MFFSKNRTLSLKANLGRLKIELKNAFINGKPINDYSVNSIVGG